MERESFVRCVSVEYSPCQHGQWTTTFKSNGCELTVPSTTEPDYRPGKTYKVTISTPELHQ